ncbi:hypothetical protein TNCT_607641 [Trichonephila clavata]|uniref:Uncharacterized protein n=1 Tax=Trichonephila clavata TaxID=2740835 RepID=A0A8X6L550_TRICU|nr:hypothetical protein TNCT_607641 [Trichonephila clavata]
MSETHSEQRKLGKVVESSANKKARREVSKVKVWKFTEDCIPDGVFPIGDDVFVFASIYYDSVSVHIRRFKKYGKTYYPTPEGITLDPQWIEYIMRKKKVPESLEELPSGLFPPERHIQITSPIENALPFSLDVSLGQRYLTQILKKSICSLLNEKGLNQPQKLAEELWGTEKKHLIHMFCHWKLMR